MYDVPSRMLSKYLIIISLCNINALDEQIYDIGDIEDEAVLADFDKYPLVSEEKRPSSYCKVRHFVKLNEI